MQMVIDIPDEQYEYLSKIADTGQEPLGYFERVIMRGTPLPKGHGRLIDAKDAYKKFYNRSMAKIGKEVLDETPTIIEADKAESEG